MVAATLGWLVMGEGLSLLQGLGGLMVIGSILVVAVGSRWAKGPRPAALAGVDQAAENGVLPALR